MRQKWQKVQDQANRYVWSDFHPRLLLLDVGDGSLIEVSGTTLIRYPAAHMDEDLGLIANAPGGAWVCVDTEWTELGGNDLWEVMEQLSDPDHPFWAGPDVVRQESTQNRQEPPSLEEAVAAQLAELRDTDDPNRAREVPEDEAEGVAQARHDSGES